jgi:hypothetical protein
MLKTKNNLEDLKKVATNLIGRDAVPAAKKRLAEIIACGIDDTFDSQTRDEWEIDEYLRDRALNFWFYPSMHLDQLVPVLADEIGEKWEIQNGDGPMLSACLATVMAYQPSNLPVTLGAMLKADPTTEDLATLEGFDIEQINQILVQRNVCAIPVN